MIPSYKKILKYWIATQGSAEQSELDEMDVTELRCEEEGNSILLIDQAGALVAEFGPGKRFDGWMLTVEYLEPRAEPVWSGFRQRAMAGRVLGRH